MGYSWHQPPWWKAEEPPKALYEESESKPLSIRDCPATLSIILVNVAVFIICVSTGNFDNILLKWGFTPNTVTQLESAPTIITSMFLHANILHLFMNMVVFFGFGYMCERRVRYFKFLAIYLISGVFALLFHTLFNYGSDIPLVGASGAIFGIIVTYGLLYSREEVGIRWHFRRIVEMPAILAVFIVILLETLYAVIGYNPYVAHLAHIGGGIAGALATIFMFPEQAAQGMTELFEMVLPIPETREYEDKDYHDFLAIMNDARSPNETTMEGKAKIDVTKIEEGRIWISEVNGKPAGYMLLTEHKEGLLFVDTIKVNSYYEERSVDISLMKKAIEIAKEKKSQAIGVRVEAANRELIRFLVEKNFQVVDREFDLYGNGKDALLLRKQLRKQAV